MPAYQLYVYEDQKKREALEQKICEQVDALYRGKWENTKPG